MKPGRSLWWSPLPVTEKRIRGILMMNNKKGVSLITVLLFMLVATIAGTATYKWLSSENSSSGSRLKMSEARQAAVAGIDAARSWMTYNANDVGGVVRQFFNTQKNSDGVRAVRLNNVLQNISGNNQNFDVYLVGVDKSNSTYKMKLVSVGTARNGTKHSEAAILNVSGLYQVKRPGAVIERHSKPAQFKEALHAGATGGVSIDVSSGIINGDATLNTKVVVDDHLIVTGNLSVISDDKTNFKDLYVHGGMASCSEFNSDGNVYINDKLYLIGKSHYKGNLYVGNGVDMTGATVPSFSQCNTGTGNGLIVDNNLTIEGDLRMPAHTAGNQYTVNGNLVIKNGRMVFPNNEEAKKLPGDGGIGINEPWQADFLGNVYIEKGITGNHFYYTNADHVRFGTETGLLPPHLGGPAAAKKTKVYTGETTLHKVTNKEGKIEYPHWVGGTGNSQLFINRDGKYLSEGNSWDDRTYPTKWNGTMDKPKGNTYCTSDKCAPTFNPTINFWQVPFIYDIETVESQVWRPGYVIGGGYYETVKSCQTSRPDNKGCHYSGTKLYHCVCEEYDVFRNEAFVQVNGEYVTTMPDTTGWMADRLQQYADAIKPPSGECKVDHIPDPIQFNKKLLTHEKMHTASNRGSCAGVGGANQYYDGGSIWAENGAAQRWPLLDECYDLALANGELYQNEWLLVRVSGSNDQFNGITWTQKFTKKVILAFDNEAVVSIPPTEPDAMILIYLAKGGTIAIQGNAADTRNVFIFSDGDVQYNNGGVPLQGSVFLADCHKIQSVNLIQIDYNETLTSALESVGALCANDESDECNEDGSSAGEESSSEGEDETEIVDDGMDYYYIATSPQLSISLESQYKNDEVDPSKFRNNEITPSVIVMPRIVYLTEDAKGTLSDYYTVLPLNRASIGDLSGTMTCSDIPATGDLSTAEQKLPKGNHTCYYRSGISQIDGSNDNGIPLYVVVSEEFGANPTVSFDDERKEVAANSFVDVFLKAPKGDRSIKFTVAAPSDGYMPSGWTIVPLSGGEKIEDDGIYSIYRFSSNTPDGSDIPLFRVTAGSSALEGEARFLLQECEGCVIGSPRHETVFMNGFVTITREDLSDYCSKNDNAELFKERFGTSCGEVVSRPSCGTLWSGSTWVDAVGQNCVAKIPNEEWQCNTGVKISLHDYLQNHSYCEAFVPEEFVDVMTLNASYPLPAAIKRKPVTLTVKINSTHSGKVRVKYNRPGVTPVGEYTDWNGSPCSDDVCEINLYAGDHVVLTGEMSSGFSYWICDGFNCNESVPGTTVGSNIYPITVTQNNTLEAFFDKKDTHCTYKDFTETTAYCSSTTNDDCIDRCKTQGCSVNDKDASYKNPNSNWLQIYENSTSSDRWKEPELKNGHLSGAQYLGGAISGEPTVLLNRIEAGYNGTLTSVFSVPSVLHNISGGIFAKPINDGFIFRSTENASEYFTLSVISYIHNFTYRTYARVCYVQGRDNGRTTCAEDVPFTGSLFGTDVILTQITKATISIVVDESSVQATLSFKTDRNSFGSAYATIDLTNAKFGLSGNALADDDHQYVGVKFDKAGVLNTQFEIFDFAWKSEKYAKSCWDTPIVNCSFKANYAGGFVPQNEEVSPFVYMSSWYNNYDCETTFYYNGCDVPSEYYKSGSSFLGLIANDNNKNQSCQGDNPKGFYQWSAKELSAYKHGEINGDMYKFEDEGLHGRAVAGGVLKEASVMVSCRLNDDVMRYDPASCGEFNVGEIAQCSENYPNLLNEVVRCPSSGECGGVYMNFDNFINTRGATIRYTINELTSGKVNVYLEDAQGNLSTIAGEITEAGTYSIHPENVIGSTSFNPQQTKYIRFVAANASAYEVSSIQSSCPNAISMTCNAPVYNATTKKWTVSANVTHPEQADKCRIVPLGDASGVTVPEATSCAGFNQLVEQDGVYGQDENKTYSFKVSALDQHDNEIASCMTPSKEIPAVTFTTCALTTDSKKQGQGVPALNFAISGCPAEGCTYSIKYDGNPIGEFNGTSESGRCPETGCDGENSITPYEANSEHTYLVEAYGQKCEKTFTIEASENKVTCVADIEDDMFKATTSSTEWSGKFVVSASPGGTVVYETDASSDGSYNFRYDLSAVDATAGTYIVSLALPGNNTCSKTWTVTNPDPDVSISGCSDVSNQEASSAISQTFSVTGCDDGCNLTLSPATTGGSTSNYNGGNISFYDVNATGGTYRATVSRNGKSDYCEFKVTFKPTLSAPVYSCPENATVTKGTNFAVTPTGVQNCTPGCKYRVKDGSTTVLNRDEFTYTSGKIGDVTESSATTKTYSLTLTNEAGAGDPCEFKVTYQDGPILPGCIAWVNGTGNYGGHCYNSGLSNMNGKCYKCNPDRGSECNNQWLNDNASESYWWLETPCDGSEVVASSSSVAASSSSISSSSGGSGSGSKIALTDTKTSFNAGTTYTLTTGSLGYGPHSLRCFVTQNESYSRTIGTFGGSSVIIDSWQTQTDTFGSLSDNSEYTFIVSSDAPNDLTCALSN